MTAANGGYSGKVRPVLTDVKVGRARRTELKKKPLRLRWERASARAERTCGVSSRPVPNDQVRLPVEIHWPASDGPSLLTNLVAPAEGLFGSLLHAFGNQKAAGEKSGPSLAKRPFPIARTQRRGGALIPA
jgi:hypothetical protein